MFRPCTDGAPYLVVFALAWALLAAAPANVSTKASTASSAGAVPTPTKAACLSAYEQAQRSRKVSRLREARVGLITCSHEACPAELRGDCGRWLAEVETDTPSVVFSAKRPDGRDAVDVRVSIDGELVTEKLDGKAVELDPGEHRFRFEMQGREPIEQQFLIRERDKGRAISVSFPADSPPPAPAQSRAVPYVLGGVAVAGLGAFTYFGLHGRSIQSDLDERQCKPRCPQGDVDSMNRSYLIANISLGVGVISLGVATWVLLRHPASPAAPQARISFGASVLPGAGIGSVLGVF